MSKRKVCEFINNEVLRAGASLDVTARRRSDDPTYLAALDELYIRSSLAAQPPRPRRLLVALALGGMVLVALLMAAYLGLFR